MNFKRSYVALLLFSFLLFLNCEESVEISETSIEQGVSRKSYVSKAQIPAVINSLEKSLTKVGFSDTDINKSVSVQNTRINYEQIMQVINEGHATNYTFGLEIDGTLKKEFYNIIVSKKPNGDLEDPYIIRYTLDDDAVDEFYTHNGDFKYFKGSYKIHKFNNFFSSSISNKTLKTTDDCPNGGDIGGSGGNGTTSPGETITSHGGPNGITVEAAFGAVELNTSAGYSYTIYNYSASPATSISTTVLPAVAIDVTYTIDGVTVYTRHQSVDEFTQSVTETIPAGSTASCSVTIERDLEGMITIKLSCSSDDSGNIFKSGSTDCPSVDGVVGILLTKSGTCLIEDYELADDNSCYDVVDIINEINFILGNNYKLEQEEIDSLIDGDNYINELIAAFDYLRANSSPIAKNFTKRAIEAILDGGEVDFQNQFIKSKDFIGTPADCVLNALISSGNNLFKQTSEAFTQGKSKYRIRFTTYTEPGNAVARTALPDPFDIIEIRFNLTNINLPSIEMASHVLHETIHAELHRIYLTNNAGPNPLPTAQYNWYVQMWNMFGNGNIDRAATGAEHSYMANYFINPIASGIREFDENTHPLENYKYFAWEGLKERGKFNGYVTSAELTNLANLSQIVTNDTHINPCD